MSDVPLAPVESTQVIQDRVLDPYLKDNITIGLVASHKIRLPPVKEPSITDKEFVFQFPQIPDYVDLKSIELYVKGSLQKSATEDLGNAADGTNEDAIVGNNALHTLFESAMIQIGCNQEKNFETMRPQKAYIRQLMHMKDKNAVDLESHGFLPDSRQFVDEEPLSDVASMSDKIGWYSKSRTVEFCAPTLLDFFQTEGFLLPNTPLSLTYRLATPEQYLVVRPDIKDTLNNSFFKITEIYLFIPVMKINPTLAPYMESLISREPARFRFESLDCRQYTIAKDMQTKFFNKCYDGRVPHKFMLAVYDQSALIGDRTINNLFTSTEAEVVEVRVYVNGSLVREFNTNFSKKTYMQAFKDCVTWFQAAGKEHVLSYDTFKNGHRYFAVDLMEGCESQACEPNLLQSGFVDIEIKFSKKLAATAVMLIYGISPDTLDIDNKRSCRLTRTVQ